MQTLLKFAHWIDSLTEHLGAAAALTVLATLGVGFYNVVARYLGRFIGQQLASNLFIELQWYLFSLTFFLGFAYILKHGVNVRVDFLYANWSPQRKAWVDLLGTLLFLLPLCALGIYVTFGPVLTSWGRLPSGAWGAWELSSDANGLPRAPLKTMILVAFGMLLVQGVAQAIKYWAIAQGHSVVLPEVKEETGGYLPPTPPADKA